MVTEGYRFAGPQEFALATPNIAESLVSIRLGLRGPNTNVSCGSLSSLVAVGIASELVDWGRAEVLLAGGASSSEEPLPRLASTWRVRAPSECAAFLVLARTGSDLDVTGFTQRRLRNGSMRDLIAEASAGLDVDAAIYHPGNGQDLDGLPSVPVQDIRDLAGEALDASGAVAVAAAAERIRGGTSSTVLVAFRDLGGDEGAALVVRRRPGNS